MSDLIPAADLSWFDSDANPVEYDLAEQPDIFGVIIQEMQSDDDAARQTAKFLAHYQDADDAGKHRIDEVLIHLCGWSLASLIQKARAAS